MTWHQLRSGNDRVLASVERTTAVHAITELIWNALDAEATQIDIAVSTNAMGAATEVIIRDDGHGMAPQDLEAYFLTEGDSHKKAKRFSDLLRRPLHGQFGRGRLLVYAIAETVTWNTIAHADGGFRCSRVEATRNRPAGFEILDPIVTDASPGTTVTLRLRDTQKAAQIGDSGFELHVLERLVESLFALEDVSITWRKNPLDPKGAIRERRDLVLQGLEATISEVHDEPRLCVIEWNHHTSSKVLQLCDETGSLVTTYRPRHTVPVPFAWTGYLRWSGFRDPDLMSVADLHVPEIRHQALLAAADASLSDFLLQRLSAERGRIVQEWQDEGVYPYSGDATTDIDIVERELFDVVAVIASPAIPKRGTEQKKLSLRLLKETLASEPTRLRPALEAVLDLPEQETESLERLLHRTRLASMIRSTHRIVDRLDFLKGLQSVLYADGTRRMFREVDQLHPMLVREPWIFGDQWDSSASEHGLTKVVKSAVEASGEAVLALEPVTLESGKRGRVDMVFHRCVREANVTLHLLVELKRPGKLIMDNFSQVINNATAIINHPEVSNERHRWDYWLLGTDMDEAIRSQRDDNHWHPGFVKDFGTYRLFVIMWEELLEQVENRLEWIRQELSLVSNDAAGIEYLKRSHALYVPPTILELGTPDEDKPHDSPS